MSAVIDALTAALEKDPENPELRGHLAGLLMDAEQWSRALEQYSWILNRKPDDLNALGQAARAAEALGQREKAESYRRLADALSGAAPGSEPRPSSSDRETVRPEPGPFHEPEDADPTASEETPRDEAESDQAAPDRDGQTDQPDRVVPLKVVKGGMSDPIWQEEPEPVTLKDVGGMENVKKRLNIAFLAPMKNPEMMKLYGKSLRGGLLLYGPPGCGKTFIARATAGELGARFVHVGISDVLDMYIGQSERNLHEIFENARRKSPCVLFFDEIDALGRKRSLMRESAGRDVVNQLLSELDNFANSNRAVFVLAATNHPWDVDTALRRPGRLDRMLLVLPPDREARLFLIQRHLEKRPLEKVDFGWLADKTAGFSGADIVHLCESAAEQAMEDSIMSGTARPIDKSDCKKALKEVKPSTRPWFETARNFAMFANEGGVYDELIDYLRANRMM